MFKSEVVRESSLFRACVSAGSLFGRVVLLSVFSFAFWGSGLRANDMNPLSSIDLASDTDWTLSVDGAGSRPIKVPGGGYNSDLQDQPWIDQKSVKDDVVYTRAIKIPRVVPDQGTVLEFGAVNYGAEVYLADEDGSNPVLVGSHAGALNPFSVDLTPYVQPGSTYQLQVKAFTMTHYGGRLGTGFIYNEAWKSPSNGWASRFAQGITRYVRLAIYPPVAISDVFVKPSVTNQSFSADVTLTNYTKMPETVVLNGGFSSWSGSHWSYPKIPSQTVNVPARGTAKVSLGPVDWTLGPGSYWWPNKPFSETYQAQLHYLNLEVAQQGRALHRLAQRFGFVEWTEGDTCYLVNGVRINFISDATPESGMSDYDAYSVSPAFLPSTKPGTGCAETWKRYMRIGIDANRLHQSTPTRAMMDAADEVGFMLVPESTIRGSANGTPDAVYNQVWDPQVTPGAVEQLAQTCRNHPSVCRYSLVNELYQHGGGEAAVETLIDAIVPIDPTRPLVFEDDALSSPTAFTGPISGRKANLMMHYQQNPQPATSITGMGESAWGPSDAQNQGLQKFALLAADGRRQNMAYYAGWDWMNYWPNFLQGMSAKRHAWKQAGNSYPDRTDGVDGWGSPVIEYDQRLFHPYLVLDYDFYKVNGTFDKGWPAVPITYAPGQTITRSLDIFNDSLATRNLKIVWTAHWDSPTGPPVGSGILKVPKVAAGFHVTRSATFNAPSTDDNRTLYFILQSFDDDSGTLLFEDDSVRFVIGHPAIGDDPVAYDVPAGCVGAQSWTSGLGMDFTVKSPIVVKKLGIFDSGSDGIEGGDPLTVQLFSISGDNSGQVLASTTFSDGSPGTLWGGSRFKPLDSPVVLAPGSYSIVAYGFSGANPNGNESLQTKTWTTNDGGGLISFTGSSRHGGSPGTLPPDLDTGSANCYAAGTFQYSASSP